MNEMSMSSERVGVYLESKCIDLKKQQTKTTHKLQLQQQEQEHSSGTTSNTEGTSICESFYILALCYYFFLYSINTSVKKNKWRWTKIKKKKSKKKPKKKKSKAFYSFSLGSSWVLWEKYSRMVKMMVNYSNETQQNPS